MVLFVIKDMGFYMSPGTSRDRFMSLLYLSPNQQISLVNQNVFSYYNRIIALVHKVKCGLLLLKSRKLPPPSQLADNL